MHLAKIRQEYIILSYALVSEMESLDVVIFVKIWSRLFLPSLYNWCPLSMQAAPSSIPTSGIFFHGNLVMKKKTTAILPLPQFKKSSGQLLAKECALSTGKLPRRLAQEQCG